MSLPMVIPPSQGWNGDDGPWSSFTLRIGSPWQDVHVFISTTSAETWVVLPQGCISSDPPDCATTRGGVFNTNASSSWVNAGLFQLDVEHNLNYTGNGNYGFDTVGLGWQGSNGPSLEHRVLVGIATKDFYLGHFGVAAKAINFTDYNDPQPSFLSTLWGKNLIPSLSFAYTAGAPYQLKRVTGSLTLGGYDASRFSSNHVSFNFADDNSRDLVVGVQSITMTSSVSNSAVSLLNEGILSFIDSTVPHIWLPLAACHAFERAFGLSYDPSTELYLVNDILHDTLLRQNANVTFKLGNTIPSEQTVDIVLPYASFDLTASYPLVQNTTRYFPIRRALNESQYTLGRTFLQEAYLTVDYGRSTFSVSQCVFNENSKQNIIGIPSVNGTANHTTSGPQASPSSHHSLPAGTIAGIAIAVIVATSLFLTLAFFMVRKIRHRTADSVASRDELPATNCDAEEIDGTKLYPAGMVEMPGDPPSQHEMPGDRTSWREMAADLTSPREMPAIQTSPVELACGR